MPDKHEFWSVEEHFVKPKRWHSSVWRHRSEQSALDRRKHLIDECGVSSSDVRVVRWIGEVITRKEADDAS